MSVGLLIARRGAPVRSPVARRVAATLAGLAGGIVAMTPAAAQITQLPGVDEVTSRARPGYDPKGLPLGGFRLYPHVDLSLGYDDNIYNSSLLDVSDRRATLSAEAALRSNWSRNSLEFDASGTAERFNKTHSENNEQYQVSANGRYDISPTSAIDANAHYIRSTEPRGSAGDIFIGGKRIVYRTGGGAIGGFVQAGRLTLRANAALDHVSYDSVRVGTTRFSQAYRDHDAQNFTGEAGLLVSPYLTVYGSGSYNRQRYDHDPSGLTLDAHGYSLLGGLGFEVNRLISARGSIGYQHQSFADPRFGNISGFAYNASVLWNPTPLLSLDLTARKIIQQSPYLDISGIVTDSVSLSADYELLRNVLVNARVAYDVDDYRGIARLDRRFVQRIGVRYLANRHLEAGLSYDHRNQASDRTFARRYDGNALNLTVRFQL